MRNDWSRLRKKFLVNTVPNLSTMPSRLTNGGYPVPINESSIPSPSCQNETSNGSFKNCPTSKSFKRKSSRTEPRERHFGTFVSICKPFTTTPQETGRVV